MFDYIIRNGRVVDGTGKAPFQADVAIQGGSIAAVGDLKDAQAREVIDAAGSTDLDAVTRSAREYWSALNHAAETNIRVSP